MTSTTLHVPSDITLTGEAESALRATSALAEPGACANCGLARPGAYCATCGQRGTHGRLTVPAIVDQVASDVLNMDRGVLFTALELTRRPGDAIRDYVQGKRVRYTGPVKYFVLTVALTTFATTQLGMVDEIAEGMLHDAHGPAAFTPAQASAFMSQWMTLFMALGVPFTAAVTHRVFRRAGMTYAEHLVLNLYSYGHQCLGLVAALLLGSAFPGAEGVLVITWTLAMTAYFAWTCARFFRVSRRRAVPLATLSMALGTLAYFAAALIFVVGSTFVARLIGP
ncbi:MAG TPA: DUF3667 domain-containing protein [Longimicrobium sp.]|nr:DUF3667 domain-containing protein [Longimicrobium sp.]